MGKLQIDQIHVLGENVINDTKDKSGCQDKNLAFHFEIFFNCAFLFCCSPFRLRLICIEKDGSNQESPRKTSSRPRSYVSVGSLPQTLLCLILTFLHLFWMIRDVRLSIPTYYKNPSLYFDFFHNLANIAVKLSILKIFWFNQEELLNMVNFLIDNRNPINSLIILGKSAYHPLIHQIHSKFRQIVSENANTVLGSILGIFYTVLGMACWANADYIMIVTTSVDQSYPVANWSTAWWCNWMTETGCFNFFINDDLPTTGHFGLKIAIGVLSAAGYLHRCFMAIYPVFLLTIIILTLRTSVNAFTSTIMILPGNVLENYFALNDGDTGTAFDRHSCSNSSPKWGDVKKQYQALKILSDMINKLLGNTFGYTLLVSVMLYLVSFNKEFFGNNWMKSFMVMFYLCHDMLFVLFSAGISQQMGSLKAWLSVETNRREIPADELLLTVNELDAHAVSIKLFNVTPLTHALIANVIGAAVTYFIICIQV